MAVLERLPETRAEREVAPGPGRGQGLQNPHVLPRMRTVLAGVFNIEGEDRKSHIRGQE